MCHLGGGLGVLSSPSRVIIFSFPMTAVAGGGLTCTGDSLAAWLVEALDLVLALGGLST